MGSKTYLFMFIIRMSLLMGIHRWDNPFHFFS